MEATENMATALGREAHRAYWVHLLRGQEPTDAYDDEEPEYQAAWDNAGQAAGSEATHAYAKDEILANAGPEWNQPRAQQTVAVEYVRHLETELAKVQRGAETLGALVTHQARDLYAMWIDVARGDIDAVRERILNSIPDVDDNPPAEQWNGTDTGAEWFWRTRDTQTQPLLGGSWTNAGDEDAQRRTDLRAHVSGTGGPSPAWVTDDADGVAAEQQREAEQHARDMAAEDGDLDDCEPTL